MDVHSTKSVSLGIDPYLIDLPGQVIDSYSVPEASWFRGPWDTTACEARCEGAMEVIQLSCSRGSSWLRFFCFLVRKKMGWFQGSVTFSVSPVIKEL